MARIRTIKPEYKKSRISMSVRRDLAELNGGIKGKVTETTCAACGDVGKIAWHVGVTGRGKGQVAFSFEIDHKIPESRGGATVLSNLQLLCRSCNRSKGAK